MNANADLNIDSLMDAYVAKNKHKNDHRDFREYHNKRLQMLLSLLGCDLKTRQAELDAQAIKLKRKGPSRNDKYYDIDWRASILFLDNCVDLLSTSRSPFNQVVYLEGMPPKIVRDLSAKYEKTIHDLEAQINQVNRAILKAILIYLFPGIENKKVKASELYRMGLPMDEPDLFDYF